MDLVYGVDPSLRHGSIVQVWKEPAGLCWLPVVEWSGKQGLSEKSDVLEVSQHVSWIFKTLSIAPRGPVVIEFDPTSVYWRSGKRQIVTLAWFLGYFVARLHTSGFTTVIVTPAIVRKLYGFSTGPKEEFQQYFKTLFTQEFAPKQLDDLDPLKGSDTLDAIMLAHSYFLGSHDANFRTPNLPGG